MLARETMAHPRCQAWMGCWWWWWPREGGSTWQSQPPWWRREWSLWCQIICARQRMTKDNGSIGLLWPWSMSVKSPLHQRFVYCLNSDWFSYPLASRQQFQLRICDMTAIAYFRRLLCTQLQTVMSRFWKMRLRPRPRPWSIIYTTLLTLIKIVSAQIQAPLFSSSAGPSCWASKKSHVWMRTPNIYDNESATFHPRSSRTREKYRVTKQNSNRD